VTRTFSDLAREQAARYPRERRRAATFEQAFVGGARWSARGLRRMLEQHKVRVRRAYLVGLKRGYRAGRRGEE
jgi:hypothetical protein